MAREIGGYVIPRVRKRMPNPRLGREVDHSVDIAVLGHHLGDRAGLGDVETLKAEARQLTQFREARLLEGYIVIVAEVIDAEHALSGAQQRRGHVKSDEPGSAGDENGHESLSPDWTRRRL